MREEARVLDGQTDLLGELLKQLDLLGGQAAHAPVVDLNRSQNGAA